MSAQTDVAPIIIKKKKVSGGDGHHGGAWKVAYADFVTAMMAFFMLMWLLNATTEKQRKGIADYFNPTIAMNRISGGGDGMFGGSSIFTEETLARNGMGGLPPTVNEPGQSARPGAQGAGDSAETEALEEVAQALMGGGGESLVTENALKHVVTRVTDEGLVIELFDVGDKVLFADGGDSPSLLMVDLARMITNAVGVVGNDVAIKAHTRSAPLATDKGPVWELSSARANKTRQLMETYGLASERINRVTGHADRELADQDPLSKRNNRLEIVLLRNGYRK